MKNSLFLGILLCLLFSGCSQTEAVRDTFSATECLNKLIRFQNNDDDLSCQELVNELKNLQGSCGDVDEDGNIQAYIELLEASEDCMEGN